MTMKNTINSKESFIESLNQDEIEIEIKKESKKCAMVQQEIREAVFYSDNLIIY